MMEKKTEKMRVGSSLNAFLEEDGILKEVNIKAQERVLSWQIAQENKGMSEDKKNENGDLVEEESNMVEERSWQEFRSTGMLWWINRILHTFGWAICMEFDDDDTEMDAIPKRVFPARVKFRGFGRESEEKGFIRIGEYLVKEVEKLLEEAKV